MIALSEIAEKCPGVINPAAYANEAPEIYFPWHKIVERVRRYRARNPKPEEKTPLFIRREFSPAAHDHHLDEMRRTA